MRCRHRGSPIYHGAVTGDYLRYPHVHGDLLAFVAEDDVWVASIGDGRARRLSADHVPVTHPRFSPDGQWVAWTSLRDGDPELYLASASGGVATRLTYWGSAKSRVCGWTPDGAVLAISSAGQAFRHHTWAYAVPTVGGPPVRLPYGPVDDITLGTDRAALLTAGSMEPARWKRYRGGGTGRCWTGPAGDTGRTAQILAELDGHLDGVLLVGDRIAVLSDHEGIANLYSCRPDGTDLRRHTYHEIPASPLDGWDGRAFYARQASTDGRRVVYQAAGELWLLEDLDGEPRPLEIELGGARPARRPRLMTGRDHLGDLSCDHDGRASAIEVRGTVHWLTHRDGPARTLTADPRARARLPRVLGRTGQVVWVTDADGVDALEVAPATGLQPGAQARRLASGELGSVDDLMTAPDGSTVAAAAHDGRLLLVDLATAHVHELAASADGPVGDLAFSPDSAWLAWSQPGPEPLRRIRLARLADRTVTDVTSTRFMDTDPVFTLDGKHLAFLSWRGFDPVYDAHFLELSFPFGCRPYLVPLAAETPSPFAPFADGRPVGGDDDKKDDEKKHGTDQDGAAESPTRVVIDLEGLPERVVPFPVEESRYSSMRAVKGGVAWLKVPLYGALGESGAELDGDRPRPSLHRFDLGKRSTDEIVAGLSWFEVSGDGTRILVRDRGRLRVVPSSHRISSPSDDDDDDDAFTVDLSRARLTADPVAWWRHAYDEAGRIMRRDFWTPGMSGVDWDGVLERYRPVLDRIAGPDDFADLLWEVVGELGTSHSYVARVHYPHEGDPVGLLGADLAPDDEGRWRVGRVLPGETSDPRARSPLAAPGVAVRAGDAVLAVDGRPVDPAMGPGPLLLGTAGKPVELTIGPAGGGDPRRVAVVPLDDDERLRYQDWVAGRRAHVRDLSGGRLGYLHIPDMMGAGWAQFHRDLRVEMLSDGLVVDLRANGGGHVSQLVVEKLARRVVGWDVPRGMRPQTYPVDAPRGPVVAVVDEHAGSDGDIIAAAIQSLGLGQVVGTRTWGGVIGIDGWHGLVDGTSITVPRYATWFDDRGWGLENHGVDPDVEVVSAPGDWEAGKDPQLDTAVRLVLDALETRPAATPPEPPP
jgi:tricorn protease